MSTGVLSYGDTAAREVSKRHAGQFTSLALLKSLAPDRRIEGQEAIVTASNSRWRFSLASALTGDDQLVLTPDAGSGRWLRMPGAVLLQLPIAFGTADAAVLLTLQAGQLMRLKELFWGITTNFTGGSSSAIGVSSTKTGFTTKGDLLGGAAGDVAAALTTALSPASGVIGAGFDTLAKRRTALWKATEILRFDRITSAFTAGAGFVNVEADLLSNDGA